MKVDFVRFLASDGIELQGWYSDTPGDLAVIHIHGKGGNGYENKFLDTLRQRYGKQGVTFFAIDTRGHGIMSRLQRDTALDPLGVRAKKGGSCFELFEESVHDIQGAVGYVKSKGKTKVVLQGHSLGGPKVVNYLLNKQDAAIVGAILLAPTDMAGWAAKDPDHQANLTRAHELVAAGQPEELLGASIGLDKDPMSAQSYIGSYEAGTPVDIYGDRNGGALLGRVVLPMIIAYGSADIGITKIDGTAAHWLERAGNILNKNTNTAIIDGAPHSFGGHQDQLASITGSFLQELLS